MTSHPDQPESSPQDPCDRPIRRWWQRDMSWDPFCTKDVKADLKGKSVRGGMWTMMSRGGAFLLQLAQVMVLARLLTPEDFGLIGMVAVLTGILFVFKDAGLSMATIQKETITHEQISSLFWVNVGISVLLSVVMASLAPVLTWYYRQPELLNVTLVLALSFPISGLIIQHQALLHRQMRFGTLTIVTLASTAVSLIVAIATAWMGWGYWALVASQSALPMANMLLIWYLVPWRPGKFQRGTGILPMLKFGGNLTGKSFLNCISGLYPNMLIGRFYPAAMLGFYTRARSLLIQPLMRAQGPIQAVATPALSRLVDQPEQYRKFFEYQWTLARLVILPIFCCVFVMHDWIIDLMLGPQWEAVKPMFLLFALSAIPAQSITLIGSLFTSQGRGGDFLKVTAIRTLVGTIGFSIAAFYSVEAMICTYTASTYLVIILTIYWAGQTGPVGRWMLIRLNLVNVFYLVVTVGLAYAVRWGVSLASLDWRVQMTLVTPSCLLISGAVLLLPKKHRTILRALLSNIKKKKG